MDIIWIIVMVKGKLITIKNLAYVIMIISLRIAPLIKDNIINIFILKMIY